MDERRCHVTIVTNYRYLFISTDTIYQRLHLHLCAPAHPHPAHCLCKSGPCPRFTCFSDTCFRQACVDISGRYPLNALHTQEVLNTHILQGRDRLSARCLCPALRPCPHTVGRWSPGGG